MENEVCQAVVVVMPVVQKNHHLNWTGGVDICVAAVMWNVSGSGERKWRRRGDPPEVDMVGAVAKQWQESSLVIQQEAQHERAGGERSVSGWMEKVRL